jgi:PAS domain S-box-containing protein
MRVLVADDSQPIRERLVSRLLRIPDIQVAEAEDTTAAIQQIETFKPDVAVLDIRMPGGGGIKALEEIKARNLGITVIIMTNYPYAQYRRKCLDAGADFFFDKSSEFEQVSETIRQLIQQPGLAHDVALRTTAAQLVEAKEALEEVEQRQRDMSLLSLFHTNSDPSELKAAHAMWEKTFDAIPDMVALFDADHRIVRVNKAMADRLNLPAIEMAGKPCYVYCHGTDHPIEGCPHEAMLHDRREHSIEAYEPHMGGWVELTVSPVLENDKLVGAIHITRDINARKQAEQVVKESETRYRELFESMHSGFALHEIICDKNGVPCDCRFLEANKAFEALTGLKIKNIIGRTVKEIMPATEARWIEAYGRVALTGKPMQIEDFSTALGRHYSVSAYSPGKGQFATVFSDITDQKNAEAIMSRARDAAEAASKAKSRFLANMSHELRTPLNAIIGLAEILQFEQLNKDQLDYVKTISASGEAMLALVADLLDFSRIELGKIEIKNETFSIRETVANAVALLSHQAGSKGIELTSTVDHTVSETIVGDAARLQQVLVNLLTNALKFTEKGFVRLLVRERWTPSGSRRVEFLVEDSGEGMSEAIMQRIFEPFQQGDNSSTRQHGGVGLGLAICRSLVEMMGGTICAESREGAGSLFTFSIQDQTAAKTPVSSSEVRAAWRGKCVCVWGDDPADMRAAESFLERCGVMPRYAESLESIKDRLIKDASADAVLCNLDTPGLMENLSEFRKLRPDVPWIAFSCWTKPLDESAKKNFSAFIDRPLKPEQLYSALMQIKE